MKLNITKERLFKVYVLLGILAAVVVTGLFAFWQIRAAVTNSPNTQNPIGSLIQGPTAGVSTAWSGPPAGVTAPNQNKPAPCFSDGTNCPKMVANTSGKYPAGYVFSKTNQASPGCSPYIPSMCANSLGHDIAMVPISGAENSGYTIIICQCD